MSNVSITDAHRAAANRLVDAAAHGVPCAPVRELLGEATVDDAYAVQSLVHRATSTGRRRLGRKIGLTSPAVQEQMGVDQPDFGVLYADMSFGDSEPLPAGRLLQPRIEAEVAFVLAHDLPERPVVLIDVIRATDFVVAAIEIVDSRIADWDITIIDTVSPAMKAEAVNLVWAQEAELALVSTWNTGNQPKCWASQRETWIVCGCRRKKPQSP